MLLGTLLSPHFMKKIHPTILALIFSSPIICLHAAEPVQSTPPPIPPPAHPALPLPEKVTIADGPFQPTPDSLKQYKTPEWFRDAKFGIWAHWGPQAVMHADWSAQEMYMQGSGAYNYHLKTYGHPSVWGYKDVVQLWKAEKFDPENLLALFKAAGAKYFIAQAVHHDNFENWDDKYFAWNSVNYGPKKDIVGLWRDATLKAGLRFGLTEHNMRSYNWMQVCHTSDTTGPLAGVPYDGNDPKYQDLYHPPTNDMTPEEKALLFDPSTRRKNIGLWNKTTSCWFHAPESWRHEWLVRTMELIDKYQPDHMYFDGPIPFSGDDKGKTGMELVAHLYNRSVQWHNGSQEAVMATKGNQDSGPIKYGSDGLVIPGATTQDNERSKEKKIQPYPWQCDDSLGPWFYTNGSGYATTSEVVHKLVDIVSKNGNLLLNMPQRADGSLDDKELTFLREMAAWIKVNGEALYATRPWAIYGEGEAYHNKVSEQSHMTSHDIRFTRSKDGKTLYAIALGWPEDGKLLIQSLATAAGKISDVTLLGANGKLDWQQTAEGLAVTLPKEKPCDFAYSLKVSGNDLKPTPENIPVVYQTFANPKTPSELLLPVSEAYMHGGNFKYSPKGGSEKLDQERLRWGHSAEYVFWNIQFDKPGTYQVTMTYSSQDADSEYSLEIGDQKITGKTAATGSWATCRTDTIGTVKIAQAGNCTLNFKPVRENWKDIGLSSISLK